MNDLDALRRLGCPTCGRPHDLLVLFDRLGDAWATERWARVTCPNCGNRCELAFDGDEVAIGHVGGDRRPSFQPSMRVRQPGLRVTAAPDGILIELLHRRWVLDRKLPNPQRL
ncbi:MAG: hypothetical protein OEP95_13940 [Myxococcales bacterium]|nr:hypothetical protein [Myxococcales bacterium]